MVTMRRCKLIGGPANGQWHDVDIERDIVELVEIKTVPLPSIESNTNITDIEFNDVSLYRRKEFREDYSNWFEYHYIGEK